MNTELPWKRFAAEAFVIVVSILLALAADAWWDGRNNEARERLALNDLAVELNQNIDQIASVTGCNRETAKSRVRYATNKLRNAIDEPAESS